MPSLEQIRAEQKRRTTERELDVVRARCRTLAGFVREAWSVLEPATEYVHNWHIDLVCEHLEAVTAGEINRLLINVPPGTSKSLIVSVMWQAWEWGPCELRTHRFLATAFNEGPVKRDTRKCRDLILSEWYRKLWPRVVLTRTGETSFANRSTGTREGVAFGSLTSQRGDRLIIDDPHSTETAESPIERANTTRMFREGAVNRLNDQERSAIVIIMQRLHDEDVSGVIIKNKMNYVHLCLPMEYEVDHPHRCDADLRTVDGDLLDKRRFPEEVVAKLKRDMGSYAYAGQYQQKPSPREGGLFKRSWFKIVKAAPVGCKRVRGWDLAASEVTVNSKPAYTAGLLLARAPDKSFYIENVVRDRLSAGKVENLIKNTASQDGRSVVISLPQDPGQAGKAQAQYLARSLAGYVVKVSTETGDKVTRAEPAAAQAEAGNIYLIEGDWNDAFLAEVGNFPGSAFKDQVDAFSRAFNELALGSRYNMLAVV